MTNHLPPTLVSAIERSEDDPWARRATRIRWTEVHCHVCDKPVPNAEIDRNARTLTHDSFNRNEGRTVHRLDVDGVALGGTSAEIR